MQYGSQRQTGQQPPSSQSLGAPHPQTQLIYTHGGPLTAAPARPVPVHCTRRHTQPRAIFTQVPVMQYQFNQRQPPTSFIQAQGPATGPFQYQAPSAYQTYPPPYYIQTQPGNLHTRGPVPLQMGHATHQPPPQTQQSSHSQTPTTRSKIRPNAIAIINPNTMENILDTMLVKEKVANEEETTPVVVSAICDGPSVEIPFEQGRRKV